ncbi:MAG: AAA family ATPase [Hyphomicrobiales bacterium]|nr:AAA family ATPase [Hyphomicrobiales bacterium]
MIQRLRLTNWRAYGTLDLAFDPGTTFVVAPNAVGKTSLIMAVAFGVYGEQGLQPSTPKHCIKAGTNGAEVEVTVDVGDGSLLTISRSVPRRGRPAATYDLDGEHVDAATAEARLTDMFGVDLTTAARLSLIVGGGHLDSTQPLNLESHLHRAFGVDGLLEGAEAARAFVRQTERDRKVIRETTKQRLADRQQIEAQAEDLQSQLEQAEETTRELDTRLQTANQARQQAALWAAYESRLAEMQHDLAGLVSQISSFTDDHGTNTPANRDSLQRHLQSALQEIEEQHASSSRQLLDARATTIATRTALDLLDGKHHTCPTCLRSLEASELNTARTTHTEHLSRSQLDTAQLEQAAANTDQRLKHANEYLTQLQALVDPTPPMSAEPDDIGTIEFAYDTALAALSEHNQTLGTLQSQRDTLLQQLDDDDALQRDQERITAAYRREGIAVAAADALQQAADTLTTDRIEPIAREVEWRWKQLFNEGGLRFGPDGATRRLVAGDELPWETLSGGERIWARLITHLLTIEASTTLATAWFDEPLEHLDPKLRRTVAAYLANATSATRPEQLIVTTYEHELVAQLASDNDSANIVYLR